MQVTGGVVSRYHGLHHLWYRRIWRLDWISTLYRFWGRREAFWPVRNWEPNHPSLMNLPQAQRGGAFGGVVGVGCSSNRHPTTRILNVIDTTPEPIMRIIKITYPTFDIHFVRTLVYRPRTHSARGADAMMVTVLSCGGRAALALQLNGQEVTGLREAEVISVT